MDPFSMMMAASRAANKKVEVVAIKPVVVKRKVGRPSATKILHHRSNNHRSFHGQQTDGID